jgi:hypothetical protein
VDHSDVLEVVSELGDRVNGHPERVRDVVPQLTALLDEHDDPVVIAAIVNALGQAWDEDASLAALRFADHPDPAVRFAVAVATPGGVDSAPAIAAVTDALIRLTRDDDDEVRNWATFGIGSVLPLDSVEVRDALFARTADSAPDVRAEALVGLAHWRDRRALPLVREQLSATSAGSLVFEAAHYLADPSLLGPLGAWRTTNPDDDEVLRAWRACDPAYQADRLARHAALLAAVERLLQEDGRGYRPFLYCDRSTTDVLLTADVSRNEAWDADGLLERSENDLERAARLVVLAIDGPDAQ